MMEGPGQPFGALAGAFLASALGSLFAAGDAAATSMPEARLQALAEEDGSPFARFVRDRTRILSRWLVCRILAIGIAAALFDQVFEQWGVERRIAPLLAVLATVLSYGSFAELFCAVARQRPARFGAFALRYLSLPEHAVIPIAEPLAALGNFVSRRVPRDADEARVTETEVEWIVSKGQCTGTLGKEPAEIIRNALEFKDRTAGEVMVPRRKMAAIEIGTPIDRVVELVNADGHSRYPVYRESIDHIVGLLYAKDVFRKIRSGKAAGQLADLVRTPVLFVTETQFVATILREMRARRLHMAIVSDEFGGVSGVITLEDIIEEIVGDIRDEYDTEAQFEDLGEGRMLVDASVSLADLAAHLKREIRSDGGNFESIGGLLVHAAGHVPKTGAIQHLDGLRFLVREADETRVVRVEVGVDNRDEAAGSAKKPADGHAEGHVS